jgi:hypothetical protein
VRCDATGRYWWSVLVITVVDIRLSGTVSERSHI